MCGTERGNGRKKEKKKSNDSALRDISRNSPYINHTLTLVSLHNPVTDPFEVPFWRERERV